MDSFFGVGVWEILLIFVVALALVGPRKLPEVAVKLGRAYRRLKMASQDLTSELTKEVGGMDVKTDMKFENPLRKAASDINSELTGLTKELNKKVDDPKPSAENAGGQAGESKTQT